MSVIRQANLLGQQRLDIPHLRAFESSIAADFDVLGGRVLTGQRPYALQGFYIANASSMINQPAANLQVVVANGVVVHPMASESGSLFFVPSDRANETLVATNSRVTGTFTANLTNYVGLDLRRSVDSTTVDLVQFLDSDSNQEVPKSVPLARTLDYRIVITTTDFSLQSNILPIAIVTTTADNKVSAITDARPMLFRLGSGGNVPNKYNSFFWLNRNETTSTDTFAGGDKQIGSMKDWMDAVMTRLWELGGGEFWYVPSSDRDLKLIRTGTPMANGEYFTWDSGTTKLSFQGLKVIFGNSEKNGVLINEITDNVAGIVLADGDCLYVDIDRTQNRKLVPGPGEGAALTAAVAPLKTLGTGTSPGSRFVIAWRYGSGANCIYTRDANFSVGSQFTIATTAANGMVRLNADASDNGGNDATPTVAIVSSTGMVVGKGLQNDLALGAPAAVTVGGGAKDSSVVLGQATVGTTVKGAATFEADATLQANLKKSAWKESKMVVDSKAMSKHIKAGTAQPYETGASYTGSLKANGSNSAALGVIQFHLPAGSKIFDKFDEMSRDFTFTNASANVTWAAGGEMQNTAGQFAGYPKAGYRIRPTGTSTWYSISSVNIGTRTITLTAPYAGGTVTAHADIPWAFKMYYEMDSTTGVTTTTFNLRAWDETSYGSYVNIQTMNLVTSKTAGDGVAGYFYVWVGDVDYVVPENRAVVLEMYITNDGSMSGADKGLRVFAGALSYKYELIGNPVV